MTQKDKNIQLKELLSLNNDLEQNILQKTQELKESMDIISEHVNYSKTDLNGVITEVSNYFCESSQYTRDELIGQQHNITRHPDMPASAFKEMWDIIQDGKIWKGKVKNKSKDGNFYWSETVITPRYNIDGHIQEYMAVRQNITAEEKLKIFNNNLENKVKEKTQELENNLLTMKVLLDSSIEGIVMIDSNGKCISMNATGLKMYQAENESEIIGIDIFENISQESIEIVKENIIKGNTEPYELILKRKDDSDYPALVKGRNIKLNDEFVRISFVMDMTEIKQKESLLIQQSKMAAMGEMIESIAHQWRQPLSTITTVASGIKVEKEFNILNDETLIASCDNIVNNAEYLSETIDDFRSFFKEDKLKYNFNMKNIFNKTKILILSKFKNKEIDIIENIDDIEMYGFANELVQVFINILNNARDELELINIKRLIFINIYKIDNNITIKIRDNAGGIPQDILPQVFNSYFTTKEDKGGTGIGLYMTKRIIINSFEGTIDVHNINYEYENNNYTGAEFNIILPII